MVRAKKVKGGGRQLKYSWSMAWGATNGETPTLGHNATLLTINSALGGVPDSASSIKLTATDMQSSLMDVDLDVSVKITNFLGLTRSVTVTVRRENRDLPQLILNRRSIQVKASRKIVLRGKIHKYIFFLLKKN